jgi:hypothetical protein
VVAEGPARAVTAVAVARRGEGGGSGPCTASGVAATSAEWQ